MGENAEKHDCILAYTRLNNGAPIIWPVYLFFSAFDKEDAISSGIELLDLLKLQCNKNEDIMGLYLMLDGKHIMDIEDF